MPASAAPAAAPAPAAEEPLKFDIWAFRVDGNTLLDDKTVEKAVYPYAGPDKGLGDVEQARVALEKAFHEAGYATVLVDIPEQDVNEGLVILAVTQGQVERLKVTGSQYHSIRKIKEKVPALAEGEVPHMPTVQAQMQALAGESQDVKVTPVMRAGKTPGKLEVELQVDDELPLHGSVEMNSRSSANTTYSRLIGAIRYDNLWQMGHSASLQYQVSPQNSDEVQVWSGTYALPTHFLDSRLALYGVGISSNTDIATAGALSVVGSGEIFGSRWILPIDSSNGFFQNATVGWDYKNFGQSVQLTGSDTQETPISYSPFMIGYTWMHTAESRMSSIDLGMHFSIRGLGNNAQEFENKRAGAKPDYLYFTGEVSHQETLPYDFRLLLRGTGQVSDQPLISNEQYFAGGPASVRGYHQTEVLGDDGMAGSLELFSPTLLNFESVQDFRLLTFLEGARLWIIQPLPGTPTGYSLASTGAGFRLKALKQFIGEFDWAYAFASTEYTQAGNMRVDFRVVYGF